MVHSVISVNAQTKHPNPTLLPASHYGLVDNSVWQRFGGDSGFISFLMARYSHDKVMNFVNGRLFPTEPIALTADEVRAINTVQKHIVEEVVASYANGEIVGGYPIVFQWEGELFVFQGTHRLSAALLNEQAEVLVSYVNCDNL